jgi:hypothetical protein
VIPNADKIPGNTKVRSVHVLIVLALPALFALSCYLLGADLSVKLLAWALIATMAGLWISLMYVVIRVLQGKRELSVLRNRPRLGALLLFLLGQAPLLMVILLLNGTQSHGISLFH